MGGGAYIKTIKVCLRQPSSICTLFGLYFYLEKGRKAGLSFVGSYLYVPPTGHPGSWSLPRRLLSRPVSHRDPEVLVVGGSVLSPSPSSVTPMVLRSS